jgi:hypothetical protein
MAEVGTDGHRMTLDQIVDELDAIAASGRPHEERLARADCLLRSAASVAVSARDVYDEVLDLYVRLSADAILSS